MLGFGQTGKRDLYERARGLGAPTVKGPGNMTSSAALGSGNDNRIAGPSKAGREIDGVLELPARNNHAVGTTTANSGFFAGPRRRSDSRRGRLLK